MARAIKLEAPSKKIESQTFNLAKWVESYTSLLLGMAVVVVVGIIIFSFAKNKGSLRQTSSVKDNTVTKQQQTNKQKAASLPKIYSVLEGDNLWTISQKLYKSGYSWVDIAKANNLTNPDIVYAGDKLIIPDVKPIIVTTAQQGALEKPIDNAIKGGSYTVVSGDNLWDIAVRAYGDGYRWVDIAKSNNLNNPDLIFEGNKLTIPR